MATSLDYLADLDLSKEDSHVVVRVNRRWSLKAADNPFFVTSIEMILMDAKGDKIHASIRSKLVKKYDKVLKEGSVYSLKDFALAENGGLFRTTKHQFKISFQIETKVALMPQNSVSAEPFSFVPFPEIISSLHDPIYLIDVMGMLTGYGNEKELDIHGKPSKRRIMELQNSGVKMNCTLCGPYVDQLNEFLGAGDIVNTVVVIYAAKIKDFNGKLILQNAFGSTAIHFNPNNAAALSFRNSTLETNPTISQNPSLIEDSTLPSLEDDFLNINPKKSISELKDVVADQDGFFIVYGTIKQLVDSYDWWYTSCNCSKAVFPDLIAYFCSSCKKRIFNVQTRFRIRFKVMDETDSTTFVIFDRVASVLLGKTCDDLLEQYDKVDSGKNCPPEITQLVDKKYLFKIEVKAGSEPKYLLSFAVKRMTDDLDIIGKFLAANAGPDSLTPSLSVFNVRYSLNGETSHPVEPQDLMSQFSTAANDQLSPEGGVECYNLSEDVVNDDKDRKWKSVDSNVDPVYVSDHEVSKELFLTPAKRDCDIVSATTATNCSPKLLKSVKIEK